MEVPGEIARRPDAVRLGRETDQLLHRLLSRRRRSIERDPRDDALADIVQALEAATSRDCDEARVVEMFERRLSVARTPPAPPSAGAFTRIRKLTGGNRSAPCNFGVDLCHVATMPGSHVFLCSLGVPVHAVPNERV